MKFPFVMAMTQRMKWLGPALALAVLGSPAGAQVTGPQEDVATEKTATEDRVQFDGLVEIRGVESDLDFDQGDAIDSSGVGIRARLGVTFDLSETTSVRAEAEGRLFEFRDEGRDGLETAVGRLQVTHQVSDEVQLRGHLRRYENIAVLEAFSADQTSIGARVQWQRGNDRVRATAEYREREYDTTVGGDGDGYQVTAQYNRRLGPYHWIRLDVRQEDMQSDNEPRRSFERQSARVKYSLPIAKRLRFRPSLEYRQWDYDARVAQGDPNGALREDSYVAPAVELAWGRASRGLYANASAEYRLKSSNDERFDDDAIRVGVRIGYRF